MNTTSKESLSHPHVDEFRRLAGSVNLAQHAKFPNICLVFYGTLCLQMFESYVGNGMGSFENYAFSARKEVPRDEGEQSLHRLQVVLGNNVRKIRVESNLSQERFGLMIGLSRQMISALESGKTNVKMDSLQRIADGLGVEPWTLLDDSADDEVSALDDA